MDTPPAPAYLVADESNPECHIVGGGNASAKRMKIWVPGDSLTAMAVTSARANVAKPGTLFSPRAKPGTSMIFCERRDERHDKKSFHRNFGSTGGLL
jgi:hypothetical protein